jgi:hypothetical protein
MTRSEQVKDAQIFGNSGVCQLHPDTLAINTARFRWLIGKSKYPINGNNAAHGGARGN